MPKPRKGRNKPLIPEKTLRIYCEGEKTEPIYINAYIDRLGNSSRKSVIRVEKTKKNTPLLLIEKAIYEKKSSKSLPHDEFWVVYDRESQIKHTDIMHEKALNMAKKNGIKVALCNVCFEYWLLLHFEYTTSCYNSFEDLIKNSKLNTHFKEKYSCPYEKSLSKNIYNIISLIKEARERGKKLNESIINLNPNDSSKIYKLNPYVGVVDLFNAIDNF